MPSQPDLRARTQQASRPAEQGNVPAVRQDDPVALAATRVYRDDFAAVLPAHVDVDAFIHLAQNALRRDEKLMAAARSNPASFIHALRDAARLGHEPGTDYYWLTPRRVKGQWEILGIEGYQGIVERMYRAGAVSTVVVRAVRAGDEFDWDGVGPPRHRAANWFNREGECVGAFAYAVMHDGSTSNVVIVDAQRIARAKGASQGADSDFSPWRNDFEKMVMKTAARDLEPWVPTSSEYRKEQIRAAAEVAREELERRTVDAEPVADPQTGEIGVQYGQNVDVEDPPADLLDQGER